MDGKVCTFIKEKSHYLMTTFIVLQGLIFLMISVLLFTADKKVIEDEEVDIRFDVFVTLVLFLFYGYMVHFAYHSIQKAYYLELIAFLIMSTTSSVLSVLMIFYLSKKPTEGEEGEGAMETSYVLGIIAAVILILGNLVYFFTAYFSYDYFEEKFFEKLGAKLKYHKMFFWVQFNNSMMKSDFGFYIMLLFADYIYDYEHFWFLIIDTLLGGLLLFFIILMRRSIRHEIKGRLLFVCISKILIFCYILYRVFAAYGEASDKSDMLKVPVAVSMIAYVAVTGGHIILICVSTFKCLTFFGAGLKEALLHQTSLKIENPKDEKEES